MTGLPGWPLGSSSDDEVEVADDYFPRSGDLAWSAQHYDLALAYKLEGNQLKARADIDAVALVDLDELHLDLHGLKVRKVTLDGIGVKRFSARGHHLVVRTEELIEADQEFRLSVVYEGKPRPISDGSDTMGWEELADGVIVAGQTNGAPSWFPCNDRPSDKASYRIEVTAPSPYHVVANGTLTSRRSGSSTTTWVYEQDEPMATYLATVQIGRYVVHEVTDEPVPMTAVLPRRLLERYDRAFGRQPEMMAFFADVFGPYPFPAYAVVVTDDALEIPLESQSLSVFGSNLLTRDWDSVRLVAHELSHQWFGNSLTLTEWRDIWLHEGFACYAEWLWSEESGGPTAHERALEHWGRLAEKPQDLVLGDPGPEEMFDDRVYKRGACLLHALRLTIGEDAFFELLPEWTQRHAHSSVDTSMFLDLAEEVSGESLEELFGAWLDEPVLPEMPLT